MTCATNNEEFQAAISELPNGEQMLFILTLIPYFPIRHQKMSLELGVCGHNINDVSYAKNNSNLLLNTSMHKNKTKNYESVPLFAYMYICNEGIHILYTTGKNFFMLLQNWT